MNYFDQIDDYLFERLSESDRTAFEKALYDDPKLKEAVSDANLAKSIGEAAFEEETRRMVEASLGNTTQSTPIKKLSYNTKLFIYLAAVAAILIIVVGGYMKASEQDKVSAESLQYANLYEEPAWPIKRGSDNDQISNLVMLFLNDYDLSSLDSLKSINSDMAKYWLSEIYAKEGIVDSVLVYAPNISDNKVLRDRIYYLKYISLIKLGQLDKADEFKKSLPKDVDKYYNKYFEN